MNVGFDYGALSSSLEDQAQIQGFVLSNIDELNRIKDALLVMRFCLMVSDTEYDKLVNRFHKMVIKNLHPVKESN